MIIGLLSDTHGHVSRTVRALEILREQEARWLIHCGDIGSEEIINLLFEQQENGLPVSAVLGNVDEWNPGLILYAKKLGFPIARIQRIERDGLNIVVFHGHDPQIMESLTADPYLDLLFTGHTHVAKDETLGTVRVINPGAVYRANPPGVSVFNTESKQLQFIPL